MTALARVVDAPWGDQVAVYLISEVGGHRLILRPGTPGTTDVIEPGVDPGPSLRLDYDTAQSLLHALAAHFGRALDSSHTRADYEHARTRLDRLTDALIESQARAQSTVQMQAGAAGPSAVDVVNEALQRGRADAR